VGSAHSDVLVLQRTAGNQAVIQVVRQLSARAQGATRAAPQVQRAVANVRSANLTKLIHEMDNNTYVVTRLPSDKDALTFLDGIEQHAHNGTAASKLFAKNQELRKPLDLGNNTLQVQADSKKLPDSSDDARPPDPLDFDERVINVALLSRVAVSATAGNECKALKRDLENTRIAVKVVNGKPATLYEALLENTKGPKLVKAVKTLADVQELGAPLQPGRNTLVLTGTVGQKMILS
jgi:hypothetical protein